MFLLMISLRFFRVILILGAAVDSYLYLLNMVRIENGKNVKIAGVLTRECGSQRSIQLQISPPRVGPNFYLTIISRVHVA